MSTFCIYPWIHAFVEPSGEVKPCCVATDQKLADQSGKVVDLRRSSFSEIWNSDAMRDIRRRMIKGERVEACTHCYLEEDGGHKSVRNHANHTWLTQHAEAAQYRERVRKSLDRGYFVEEFPAYLDLRPGNICNLKCRMCEPKYSSAIRADRVHSKWTRTAERPVDVDRFNGLPWHEQETVVQELLEHAEDLRHLYLAGGEPLLTPGVNRLVDVIIERGIAPRVSIQFSTNLTVYSEEFIEKLKAFAFVKFLVSVDGYEESYDYVRYPETWKTISTNLERLTKHPHIKMAITPTVQMTNVLDMPRLLAYVESLGFSHHLNPLYIPLDLSVRMLPLSLRQEAARKLVEHATKSEYCKRDGAAMSRIKHMIDELAKPQDFDIKMQMHHFMTFTNDLDISRGQSFRETFPRIVEALRAEGYEWVEDTKYAEKPVAV